MAYIKWDAPGVEGIQPGEEDLKLHVASQFNQLQKLSFTKTAHCMRATHLKTQGCVHGTLTINANLPTHLAQGMFSAPGKHDLVMRYSSLPPQITPDTAHAPRGLGIKVFDVPGPELFGNESTQDFTFNNYRILELRDIPAAAGDAKIAGGFTAQPQRYMTSMPQWSQGAYRYGDYVAKFAVFPTGEEQSKLKDVLILDTDPVTILSDSLRAFHKENVATFSFNIQLLENLQDQPVEDLGIEWDETKYPFVEVGRIEIPKQDNFDDKFRRWLDDSGVQCNPWHGLEEHRPLGGAQRVRRQVYAESRKLRMRMNGKEGFMEPKGVRQVPFGA